MLKQFKYAFRSKMNLRIISFVLLVLLNILPALVATLVTNSSLRFGMRIVAVVFSSIALCIWLIVCIIADYDTIRGLFSAPKGYHILLAPVSGKQILGGRLLAIVIPDVIGTFIGIVAVVLQSLRLANADVLELIKGSVGVGDTISLTFYTLGQYTLFILYIFLIAALAKSIFYSRKSGTFLGIIIAIAISYVLGWMNLILLPFTSAEVFGPVFNITVYTGLNAGMVIYILLTWIQAGILFAAVSYLMERRLNI